MKSSDLRDYLTYILQGLVILETELEKADMLPIRVVSASSNGESSGLTDIGSLIRDMEDKTGAAKTSIPKIAQRRQPADNLGSGSSRIHNDSDGSQHDPS